MIIKFQYKLRMLSVPVDEPALLLGDNQSMIMSSTVPSSVLKKKHNSCAYHRIREAISAKIMRFSYMSSLRNVADILTKPVGNEIFHTLTKPMLFQNARDKGGVDSLSPAKGS